MAYDHTQYEILMTATAASATATGDIAKWSPGYVPHVIRAVAIIPTVSGVTLSGAVFNFNHLSLVSGSSATTIDTINGTATVTPGRVMYADGLNVKVSPGEEVICNVGTAKSALNVKAVLFVEPKWEQPGNDTSMVETT